MRVRDFLSKVKKGIGPMAYAKLQEYAKAGVIKWGRCPVAPGPKDHSGG